MGAMTLQPRERRLALIAAVLIGCWLFLSWLVQPLWEHVRALRLRVETHTEKLAALSRLLEQAPSVEREYQEVAAYLETADDEQAHRAFLNELEGLSREAGVHLNLKPRPVSQDDRLSRFEVELDAEGPQPNLIQFLDTLLRLPRLIAIERLRLATAPGKEGALRANLVIQKLTLRGRVRSQRDG